MPPSLLLAVAAALAINAAPPLGQAPAPPPAQAAEPPQAPAQAPPPPAPTHDEHQGSAREYPSLKISGFGDINFARTEHVEGPRGFFEGQLTLHMASELSARTTFFGEISFTPRVDAGTGSPAATGFNTEVERMMVRFDRSDQLKASVGRYHTPINYWNTAFHHGQWLQTTISRPEMIQFGGRVLPVHFVGGLVEGAVPAGGLNLNYKAGIGNGRGSVISRGGDAGDVNGDLAWLVNGFIKPDALFGLQAGGAFYDDRVRLSSGAEFDEQIVSAHAAWQKETPEIIFEYAGVRHRNRATGVVAWTPAYYIQAAYRLPFANAMWKPYFRFEHIAVDAADLMFAGVPSLDATTAGVRWDVAPLAAIKFEYRTWTRGSGTERNQGGYFQLCFTF
ncbi:MAG TPA: hypothetical protein VMS54_00800 [Vicinamibacterales bacterium]|nr:hypothetical protein [Vicinamibacterales bacterium]